MVNWRAPLWTIFAVSATAVLVCLLLFAVHAVRQQDRGPSALATANRPPKNTCGPEALFTAINRLGIPVEFPRVQREFPPQDQGVSFRKLTDVAVALGCDARLQRMTWQTLASADATAVLWLARGHFITVDPRETSDLTEEQPPRIRVYDMGSAAQWWSRDQLEAAWKGDALVLRKTQTPARQTKIGPCLEWAECLYDVGNVPSDKMLRYTFGFRNRGKRPLKAKIAAVACDCAKAELSQTVLPPHETGQLTITVDPKAKRGYFQTNVLFECDDPDAQYSRIYLRGAVHQETLVSTDTLYFGQLPKGTQTRSSFCLYDAGKMRLEIMDVRVELDNLPEGTHAIESTLSVDRLTESTGTPMSRQRLPLRTGDYLVTVGLRPTADCPVGPVAGRVIISTNRLEQSKCIVSIKGTVASSVVCAPPALLLTVEDGRVVHATLDLKEPSGKAIDVPDVTLRGAHCPLLISSTKEETDSGLRLSLCLGWPKEQEAGVCHGTLVLNFGHGDQLSIPVVIHSK